MEKTREAPFGHFEDGTPVAPYGCTPAGNIRLKPLKGQEARIRLEYSEHNDALAELLNAEGVDVEVWCKDDPDPDPAPPEADEAPEPDPEPEPDEEPEEVVPELEPEPEPEPRDWLMLSEVEDRCGVHRSVIADMVKKGWIAGMEPGRQGRPQEWHPHHVEALEKQLRARRIIAGLSEADLVAGACNLDPHRLETCVAAITSKGIRLIDASSPISSLSRISKEPIVIFPK